MAYDLRNHGESEKRLPSAFGEIEYLEGCERCLLSLLKAEFARLLKEKPDF